MTEAAATGGSEAIVHAQPDGALQSETERKCVLVGDVASAGALCDVLSFLAHAAWWGELVVEHTEGRRSLYFDEGYVVAARSTVESERLGAVLCRCGVLTQEQADACRERAGDRNLRFGEALVELGFVSREQLFTLMNEQVRAIFSGLAAVDSGRFCFFEGFDDADLSFRQKHGVDGLLLEAIREMDESPLRSRIPDTDHVPVRAGGGEGPASDPLGIYAAIDGKRSVAQVAQSVGVAELEVKRALFQHVQSGHATIAPPRLGVRRTVEVYNDAIVVLLRELDAMDEGDGVRESLAKFASAEADSFLADATPAEDGTLDVDETVARIDGAPDSLAAEDRLAKWLYDYASYAVFLARPHLDRREDVSAGATSRVSRRVADLLDPLAPRGREPAIREASSEPVTHPTVPSPSVADRPGASTVRMKRVTSAIVPGLVPSRTVRMSPVSLKVLARTDRARGVPAFTAPPPVITHAPVVVPAPLPSVAAPMSGRKPPIVAIVAIVAAVFLAIGVILGAVAFQLVTRPG